MPLRFAFLATLVPNFHILRCLWIIFYPSWWKTPLGVPLSPILGPRAKICPRFISPWPTMMWTLSSRCRTVGVVYHMTGEIYWNLFYWNWKFYSIIYTILLKILLFQGQQGDAVQLLDRRGEYREPHERWHLQQHHGGVQPDHFRSHARVRLWLANLSSLCRVSRRVIDPDLDAGPRHRCLFEIETF